MSRLSVAVCLLSVLFCSPALAQDRGGFTALVDVGAGVQNDASIDGTEIGLSGLNAGIGGFVTKDLSVMFRIVSTGVTYDLRGVDYRQISGFGGPAIQYWLSDKFNVEAGTGVGFWTAESDEDARGLGLMFGAGISVFNRGKHNLQLGVQYAPAFTEPGTVHNIGVTFGYQFQ